MHKLWHMQLLRGLRLNCFLAALTPCLIACFCLVYQQQQHQKELISTYSNGATDCLQNYAEFLADPTTRSARVEMLSKNDERWQFLAVVSLSNDADRSLLIEALKTTDHHLIADDPHPSLINSLIEAQYWKIAPARIAVACPLRHNDQDMGVLYGEVNLSIADNSNVIISIISGSIIICMLIAWYLSQRIYKPIEYLCNETEATINGESSKAKLFSSAETARVASSINDLLNLYQAERQRNSQLDSESLSSKSQDE